MSDRKTIDSFTLGAGYAFLSNFHPSSIRIDGHEYKTVEHAYQAHKTTDESVRDTIRKSPGPAEAKKLGRAIPLRHDWEEVRIGLMRKFIAAKFESPFLAHQLLSTGDTELVYGNTWNDRFWGVCRGTGLNWLGKILMERRDSIRRDPDYSDLGDRNGEASSGGETGPETAAG